MATTKTSKKTAPKQPTTPQPSGKKQAPTGQPSSYAPPVYDPAAGKQALEALGAELAALGDAEIGNLRVDVEAATYAALGVAGFIGAPEVKARFERLPPEEFDMTAVSGLGTACFATLYALAEARAAGALESEARIAPEVAAEAAEVEARMQALCEYQLQDDPEIRPELDRLRPGVGHRDLANDLLGYARIYDLRADLVKGDQKHYRPTDAARARELAGKLIQALSAAMTPRARAAYDSYSRAWALLRRRYDEVRAAGLWLFRADAARDERFPSLFAAARPNGGRPKKPSPGAAPVNGTAPNGEPLAPSTDPPILPPA